VAAAALIVVTFASEETAARLAICQPPQRWDAPLAYVGATLALALVYWVATAVDRRRGAFRGAAPWLIGVSIAGLLFSGWIASLGIGFWGGGQLTNAAEVVLIGCLFVVAFTGPSVASLVAAIFVRGARARPKFTLVAPLVLLGVTAVSVALPLVKFGLSCV
jgi:hypothetical protein